MLELALAPGSSRQSSLTTAPAARAPCLPDERQITELSPSRVQVGVRLRKDFGNLDELAQSIDELGLLHPIVVTPAGELIAGARRLRAWERTRYAGQPIPCKVVDLDEIVRGEAAENLYRKQFTLSEAVSIKRKLEPIEAAAAKERQGTRTDKHPEKFSRCSTGRAADKVARAIGISRWTLAKAEEIVEAAEAEPHRFSKHLADMDRIGRADGPHKRVKVARQAASIRAEPPPLPGRGPYRVIVADPPWPYAVRRDDPTHRATHSYPQMSIEAICALDVAGLAAPDCALWLWTTNHHMREAFGVLDAWGFEHKTILTWGKDRMGIGDWLRGQTEHCLLAVRGKPVVQLINQTTLLHGPVRKNSQKPEEFYAFVEGLCPAPRYCELFARATRPNWDGHGDEAGQGCGR